MKSFYRIFLILILCSTFLITGCTQKQQNNSQKAQSSSIKEKTKKFKSKKYNFTIVLPKKWEQVNAVKGLPIRPVVAVMSPEDAASLGIIVQIIPKQINITLDMVEKNYTKIMKSKNLQNFKKERIMFAGVETIKAEAHASQNGESYISGGYVFLYNHMVYQIFFDIDGNYVKQYKPLIEESIKSFKLKK